MSHILIKGLLDEDFVNYKVPSVFISTNTCTLKCDIENGSHDCQNSSLLNQPSIDMDLDTIISRYLSNPITKAIVFGGLEPFDQFADVYDLVFKLRNDKHNDDPVVIYTGYNKNEIDGKIRMLEPLGNIIVKFGRYKPENRRHYDPILGVNLASDNQYAEQIS